MQQYIAKENIRRFERQLEHCTDEERATINALIAEEKAKLKALLHGKP